MTMSKFDRVINELAEDPVLKNKYLQEKDIPEEYHVPSGDFAILTAFRKYTDETETELVPHKENLANNKKLRAAITKRGLSINILIDGHYHEDGVLVSEDSFFVKRPEGFPETEFTDFIKQELVKYNQESAVLRMDSEHGKRFYLLFTKGDTMVIGNRISYDRLEYEKLVGWSNFTSNPDYGFGFTY